MMIKRQLPCCRDHEEKNMIFSYGFAIMGPLCKEEYHLEGGKTAEYVMGNYRHNLEQPDWKQAESYRVAKRRRPVKGAPSEYSDYIRNFKHVVQDELFRVEMFLNNKK